MRGADQGGVRAVAAPCGPWGGLPLAGPGGRTHFIVMSRIHNRRTASALALAFGLALSAGTAAAGPISNSTNQTLGQVLGNRQTLPVPTDPNIGLQSDRAYRLQLQQQDLIN